MKPKHFEILIVMAILFGLAFVFGCKDEAEAATKSRVALKVDEDIRKAQASEPKVSLDFIPTWPDYIELEKDLIIDLSHKNDPNNPTIHYHDYVIVKGTRIYFKD